MTGIVIGTTVATVSADLIINAITKSCKSMYFLVKYIKDSKAPGARQIKKNFVEMDIISKVKIVESLMQEIEMTSLNNTTLLCLKDLGEILNEIHYEMDEISRLIAYNKSLWVLTYWRSYDCSKNIKNLKKQKKILCDRLKTLFELIKVSNIKLRKSEKIVEEGFDVI